MQNAGIAALGLDWRYLAFEVRPDELRQALAGARAMRYIGVNLTVPHKVLAMEMMDALDESARQWGAVNTVRFEGLDASGAWRPLGMLPDSAALPTRAHGFNTDADALAASLREDLQLQLRGARVLLLGVGGAGRVAALRLAAEGVAALHLVNRTVAKAQSLALELRSRYPDTATSIGYPDAPVDLMVNATSLGLGPGDDPPWDERCFSLRRAGAVYDMIYRPVQTQLLKAAAAAGCRTANGLGMLLRQGAAALEIWAGRPAPIGPMRAALKEAVYAR